MLLTDFSIVGIKKIRSLTWVTQLEATTLGRGREHESPPRETRKKTRLASRVSLLASPECASNKAAEAEGRHEGGNPLDNICTERGSDLSSVRLAPRIAR